MATFRSRKNRDGSLSVMARGNFPTRTFRGPKAKQDAKHYAAEEERKIRLGEHYIAIPESFGHLLDAYIERKSHKWAWKTWANRKQVAKTLAPLRDLKPYQISRGVAERLIEKKALTAPRQAQEALILLKAVLREAMYDHYRVDMAVFGIQKPVYESRQPVFLTMEQLRELASYAPDNIHRLILIAGMTGMRQGELFDLKAADVHLEDTPYVDVLRGKTKNAKRKVFLTREAARLFAEQMLLNRHSEYVFPSPKGHGRWDPSHFMARVFVPAREAAGLACTFHDLRHTFISWAAAEGMNRETVGALAGWSQRTVDKMFEVYRHVSDREIRAGVEQLSKAMEAGQG